jgi:hypothetical protein
MPAVTRFSGAAKPQYTPQSLLAKLRAIDSGFRMRWLALFVAGAFVSMTGPMLFGSLFWLKQFKGQGVGIGDLHHSWLWHVGVTAAWFLPILFLVEWVTRGKLMEDAAAEAADMGRYAGGRLMQGAFLAEMCLWGPRMVIAGVTKQVGLGKHARTDRKLAAEMLATLLNAGEGIGTGQLYLLAKGNDQAFADVLAYLMFHDLIGVSAKGDRAWLLSDGKRQLGVK